MRRLFVTGTDTGVGKTFVSVAILRAAERLGLTSAAMKPAESGCAAGPDGALVPDDARRLRDACSLELDLSAVCPYRFEEPVAPGVAAARTGKPIDLKVIEAAWAALAARGPDLLLAEGAGGLLVPFADDLLVADLAAALGAPLVIVARESLGTINHSLLTVEAAHARGLSVEAVILNPVDGPTPEAEVQSNAREIERIGKVRVLSGSDAPDRLLALPQGAGPSA